VQAEDGIRDPLVTGVQTCALPICQLVAQFFYEVLGYRRPRVRSEHKHNDVRVHDNQDRPWLVVEVKALLETERHRRAARRQGFRSEERRVGKECRAGWMRAEQEER